MLTQFPIVAHEITYSSGFKTILKEVSLAFKRGEFVGFIGGSGSGKTTLMTCLNGYSSPSTGKVFLNGTDSRRKKNIRHLIGYVPQDDIIHKTLKVEHALRYAYRLRSGEDQAEKVDEVVKSVLEIIDLTEHRNKKIASLSGGQRKRVNIALELLHSPSLFFLDEPTAGLDPGLERQLMKFLADLANENRVVVLTTHLMQNILLFDVLVYIHKGYMIYMGPAEEIAPLFRVADIVDLFDKINKADPSMMRDRYLKSSVYKQFLLPRLYRRGGK
jgi:ABC transport system ATP-binding/permease protein